MIRKALKSNLNSFLLKKINIILIVVILLLPILFAVLNYFLASDWIRVFEPDEDFERYYKILILLSEQTAFHAGVLQSYFVYIAPLILAIIWNANLSESISSRAVKYLSIYNNTQLNHIANYILFLTSTIIVLGCSYFIIESVGIFFVNSSQDIYASPEVKEAILAEATFKKWDTIALSYLLILIIANIEYLFIRIISPISKNIYLPVFILLILHLVQFTHYVFISSFYVLINKVLYSDIVSQLFYFPKDFISDSLLKSDINQSWIVLIVTFIILFVGHLLKPINDQALR